VSARVELPAVRVVSLEAAPLSVPLSEPFVIASGRLEATRAALVTATIEDGAGRRVRGLGEAAALPPVTHEDQPDLLRALGLAPAELEGRWLEDMAALEGELGRVAPASAVVRSGVAAALLDAWARLAGVPLAQLLAAAGGGEGGAAAPAALAQLSTDITLSIGDAARVAATAARHREAGFRCFKVKVGRDLDADRAALAAVQAAVPDARFRIDANAGYSAADALRLLDAALGAGLALECFEQPCARDDLAAMAEVTARSPVPVVADESFRGAGDLARLVARRAAHGVNLKLAKLGGPLPALALGREARRHGLSLMAGAMVETRLGIATMAHVVSALGGVDWVDLDTAFLLAEDPFEGGYDAEGPLLTLTAAAGTGVAVR
jgi:L-alanine-DL-glutamate epimerase-like enolase superfamily enzyme